MYGHAVRRDAETGLPKWVFKPQTFDPRPTWLKTPWTTVEKIKDADEALHQNILQHGEEAFQRHVAAEHQKHVGGVRQQEAELDKRIEKKLQDLKQLIKWKFEKLVAKQMETDVESLQRRLATRLVAENERAALRWMEEEEELEEERQKAIEDQLEKIEERKEKEIHAKKTEAIGIWDGELEKIRIYEEAKTRRIHREDMTELCEGIWDKIEYLRRRMEASKEDARRRGAAAFDRDAARRRQLALEAGLETDANLDDADAADDDELRREKERRDLETKLMNLTAASKEEMSRLKSAIGDVIIERRRAEKNVDKVLGAFERFADVGLGVVEKQLTADERFHFLLKNPVIFVNPKGGEGGEMSPTEEMRMVDGCANLWSWIKDWMVERVQGAMTRKRNRKEEENQEGGGEEEEGEDGGEEEQDEAGSSLATFDDEAVAKKVFNDLLRATIEAHGSATVDDTLRMLTSRLLKAMLGEEADREIDEELERRKRPEVKRGEWELAAVDCVDGNRVMW